MQSARFLASLEKKSALLSKSARKEVDALKPTELAGFESFLADAEAVIGTADGGADRVVDAYVQICSETLGEQKYFMRSGRYRLAANQAVAQEQVYSKETVMLGYMLGLAVTQFLWPQHRVLFDAFRDHFIGEFKPGGSYLEIGPGHGLFMREALQSGKFASILGVDLSETSLKLTRKMLDQCGPAAASVKLELHDIFQWNAGRSFDAIVMGEVLEHVEDPKRLLQRIRDFGAPACRFFFTTCANCPAIDHVYHFHAIEEVRSLIEESGYRIEHEYVFTHPPMFILGTKNKVSTENCGYICVRS